MRLHASKGAVSWDGLGAGVSFACAVHCALLPLAFALLPSLNLALRSFNHEWHGLAQWLLWTHEAERIMASVVVAFAMTVLSAGFAKHRRHSALIVGAVGALMLLVGAFAHWHHSQWLHVALQVCGGLTVAAAHVLNLRLLRAPTRERSESVNAQAVMS